MRKEFPRSVKVAAFTRAKGYCEKCGVKLHHGRYEYDHRIADAFGGKPILGNCEVLCSMCHDEKTHGEDITAIAKVKRIEAKNIGAQKKRKGRPMPGNKDSDWKHTVHHGWVRRGAT